MQVLTSPDEGIRTLAVSPDSRYLAVGGPNCHVWNLGNPEAYPHRFSDSSSFTVGFTSDTIVLAASGDFARWWRYDCSTGLASDFEFRNGAAGYVYIAGCALHPRGEVFKVRWVHDLGGSQARYEWASYRLTASGFEWMPPTEPLTQGGFDPRSFSPAGDCYACKYYGGGYDLRDAITDEVVQAFAVPDDPDDVFDSVTFTPDSRRMFVVRRSHVLGFDRAAGVLPVATVAASSRPGVRGPRVQPARSDFGHGRGHRRGGAPGRLAASSGQTGTPRPTIPQENPLLRDAPRCRNAAATAHL